MQEIPREDFLPPEHRVLAYRDEPVHIGFGQTISQPYMTALMAEVLELDGTETVLEVGSGCGYRGGGAGRAGGAGGDGRDHPGLVQAARANLRRTGRDRNVTVVQGDGSMGDAEGAPYDAISVAAGAPDVPAPLLDQLADPGRLTIPVGGFDDQELRVIWKRGGRIESRVATQCRFVPLRGGEGWR